ncbi:MAG: hypothetical protein K2M31_07670 [Muribaculaceae bacterium]|nr:hypothetical protein [Muribaculaceae bacterium]
MRTYWKNVKATQGFRKFLTFLIFVVVAALFWFILALNDNLQEDLTVRVNVYNIPDSVTFISDPPKDIHVMVRDKGTNLWRNGVFSHPTIELNFKEYGHDGIFEVSKGELTAGLKKVFGQTATLVSTSIDNMRLVYTTSPGKRVPVDVTMDLTASVGKVITGKPVVKPGGVLVYGSRDALDSISRVYTEKLRGENLEESKKFTVKLKKIPGVKIDPSTVEVTVDVEQLVRKQVRVNIQIDNKPEGSDLLLFPSTANVEYYLPMSKFGQIDEKIDVRVDYRDMEAGSGRLPLHLGRHNSALENIRLLDDDVEYTLVKN